MASRLPQLGRARPTFCPCPARPTGARAPVRRQPRRAQRRPTAGCPPAQCDRFRARLPAMSDLARVEKELRLAGERLLLGGGGQHGHWSGGLSEVASALVLLCDLPREMAEEIID